MELDNETELRIRNSVTIESGDSMRYYYYYEVRFLGVVIWSMGNDSKSYIEKLANKAAVDFRNKLLKLIQD
jgi:hypothetical protein